MTEPEEAYLKKHVLICIGDSCGAKKGAKIRGALKDELRERDIRQFYRDGECTCIGLCRDGVNAVIWPEGTYLADIKASDVPRLVDYLEGKGLRLADLEANAAVKIELKKCETK